MAQVQRWWLFLWAYAVLLGVSLIPVWLVGCLPLSDYSNHLARMHILMHASDSAVLRQFYEVHWSVIPNLAMDAVVPMLATLVPLEIAGKIFVTLIFFLISSGTIALHYAVHQRLSAWPFIVFMFLYNSMLILGVMSYLFSLGLSLWALAAWISLRGRSDWRRFPLFYLIAVLLFFFHLSAFCFYAVIVFIYELRRAIEAPYTKWFHKLLGWVCTLGQFVIPALLLFFGPTRSSAAQTSYWAFFNKIIAPLSLVYNYNFTLDLITLVFIVEILILGFISHHLVLEKSMKMAVVVFILVFFLMPSTAFSSNYADYRLVPALACLFIASSDYRMADTKWPWGRLAIIGLAGLFVLRIGVLSNQWRELDKQYDEYLQAIDKLPVGSRLFSAFARPDGEDTAHGSINFNAETVPSYAVIRRSAFVPLIYADIHVVPISFTPTYEKIAAELPGSYFSGGAGAYFDEGKNPDWSKLKQSYDYWLIGRESLFNSPLPAGLETVFSGRDFHLYRVMQFPRQHVTLGKL